MPYIHLQVNQELSEGTLREISLQLLEITAGVLRKKPEVTEIVIEHTSRSWHWSLAGQRQTSVMYKLDISITKGTNTDEEKACWISAAHRLMSDCLLQSELVNYITINEIPAGSWGYNGVTQHTRMSSK